MAPLCRYNSTSSVYRARARSHSYDYTAGPYTLNRTFSVPNVSNYKPTWSSLYNYGASQTASSSRYDDHYYYPNREYSTYHSYHYPRRYYYSSYVPSYTYTLYSYLPSAKQYMYSDSPASRSFYNAYTCDTHYRSPFNRRSYLYSTYNY